jgi:hypothetical protein
MAHRKKRGEPVPGVLHCPRTTSWSARATPTCISCRSRSTRRAWCGRI